MANKIEQRLIAAGATPALAKQFATQYEARAKAMGVAPKKASDMFDEEVIALTESEFPTLFSWMPSLSNPDQYESYLEAIRPGEVSSIKSSIGKQYPNFYSGYQKIQQGVIDDYQSFVANEFLRGTPSKEVVRLLKTDYVNLKPALTTEDLTKDIDSIYGDAAKYFSAVDEKTLGTLKADKNFKAKLPDPSFTYGDKTDYAAKTIDFRTNPLVIKALNKVVDPTYKYVPGAPVTPLFKINPSEEDISAARQVGMKAVGADKPGFNATSYIAPVFKQTTDATARGIPADRYQSYLQEEAKIFSNLDLRKDTPYNYESSLRSRIGDVKK